ncbi:MAG: hypothetical protein V3V50_09235 [Gammaproteobacteria bacterium]
MKLIPDPPPANDLRVLRPMLKWIGYFILFIALALIAFDSYWPHYLRSFLLAVDLDHTVAEYVVYVVGHMHLLLIAIGGFMVIKARKKPVYPTNKNVEEGKF